MNISDFIKEPAGKQRYPLYYKNKLSAHILIDAKFTPIGEKPKPVHQSSIYEPLRHKNVVVERNDRTSMSKDQHNKRQSPIQISRLDSHGAHRKESSIHKEEWPVY